MALHIHTATRADAFVGPVVELLAAPLADPMISEVIGIPTQGMERWLSQQLALELGARDGRHDGICANIGFLFMGSLIARATAAVGVAREIDPWGPERAVWPLVELVDEVRGASWLGALNAHLGIDDPADDPDGVRSGRRYAVLRHLSDLFDRYAMHRPEMILAWAAGEITDGGGTALAPQFVWQAHAWRLLRERIGVPSPAERLAGECDWIRANPGDIDLPPRLAIVGLTRVPATYLRVLEALGEARDLHLFLLYPSPALWNRLRGSRHPLGAGVRRRDDPGAGEVEHPLLGSWGRDSREMQFVLGADHAMEVVAEPHVGGRPTLLEQLQADIRANRAPVGKPLRGQLDMRPELAPDDRSLQVHSCHGRARQVEVLRNTVLHLLNADPTLEARDVIVLCPEIEAFAPLIDATFGASDALAEDDSAVLVEREGSASGLRVRIADRSLRDTNPLLAAISGVLDLVSARATATQVLELASCDPVRQRFGFSDDDLARVEDWVQEAGIRWGLDGDGRASFAVAGMDANTWVAGLDRVLVGVAVAERDARLVGGVLPLDGIEAGAIDLAGRVVEFVERLRVVLDTLRGPHSIDEWVTSITAATDLMTALDPREAWQRAQLTQLLADVAEQSGGTTTRLALKEMRAVVGAQLHGRASRASFRTGHMTVSGLVPMRGVPHRVVCLLGLDDGVFPRTSGRHGDDILLSDPRVGDRDARSDDLQQLLDAVMAAQDHLVITYAGRSERTNVELPPSVPVGELKDVIARMVRTDLAGHVCIDHPLQPFDPKNFALGALASGVRWSFDAIALDGARALVEGGHTTPPFLRRPLAPLDLDTLDLAALVRFVEHPMREFLRARFDVRLRTIADELADGLPVDLDGLAKWSVGDRMLAARRAGVDLTRWEASERARGTLPPGALGDIVLDEIAPNVEMLIAETQKYIGTGEPRPVEVDIVLVDGRRLIGSVPAVHGDVVQSLGYSRLAPKARLRAWVYLLALAANDPSARFRALTIGRHDRPRTSGVATARLDGVTAGAAGEFLGRLIAIHDDGMCTAPTIFTRTSAMYADATKRNKAWRSSVKSAWEGPFGGGSLGENDDPAHKLILGGRLDFDEFWNAYGDRVVRNAHALWDDLLGVERLARSTTPGRA